MSTPGSVHVMAHKHFDAWAGKSAVMKALDGVAEVSSEKGCAVVSGHRSVNILGGADGEDNGAVIIEALGKKKSTTGRKDSAITKDSVSGIVLKSWESDVAVVSKRIALNSIESTTIYSGKEDSSKGVVRVVAAKAYLSSKTLVQMMTDNALVQMTKTGVTLLAKGQIASLAGGGNVMVQSRTKIAVPIWADTKDVVSKGLSTVNSGNKSYQKKNIGTFYTLKNVEKYVFGKHGKPVDYKTDKGSEGFEPMPVHSEMEPFWIRWKDQFDKIKESPVKWYKKPSKFNKTIAFPGSKDGSDPHGKVWKKEKYINLKEVYGKSREEVKDDDQSTIQEKDLKELEI